MVDIIVPVALFLSLAFATVGVTRVISDGRTRRRLLESNASVELASAVVARPTSELAFGGPLKWGLLLGSVGIALVIVQFLPYEEDDPIVMGVILLFAAAGLLGFYTMARRLAPPVTLAVRPVIDAGKEQPRLGQ